MTGKKPASKPSAKPKAAPKSSGKNPVTGRAGGIGQSTPSARPAGSGD